MESKHLKTDKQKKRRNISPLAPIGLALISYVFFLVMTIVPPHLYEGIMREDDLIFLNPAANLFVAMCILSFIAGVLLFTRLRGQSRSTPRLPRRPISRMGIILPLVAATALNVLSLALLVKNNPEILFEWLRSGAVVKTIMHNTDSTKLTLGGAEPLAFGICCWGLWRLLDREKAFGRADWGLRAVFSVSFLFAVYVSVITLNRATLLPGFFGVLAAFIIHKHKDSHTPLRKYAASMGKAMMAIMGIFVLFAFLRGSSGPTLLIQNVVGYTGASYNRLAAVLDGSLIYPYGGTGIFAFNFLDSLPLLHNLINIGRLLGMPEVKVEWLSEFPAVARTGLDGLFIWSSAFGYVYSDLGWWLTVLYFFFVGVFSSSLWMSLNRGRSAGIILYPFVAFSILAWCTSYLIVMPSMFILAGTALLLSAYESFLTIPFSFAQRRGGVGHPLSAAAYRVNRVQARR